MSGSTPADVLELTTDPAAALALMGDSNRLVRDDFAGPGGWSTGIADLLKAEDLTEVALEWDAAACLTRVANGHVNTLRADVAAYPVEPFLGRTVLYIGSPPCQTFSPAGDKSGRAHVALLCECVRGILLGHFTYEQAMARLEAAGALDDKDGNPDPRNGLILIPARVIRQLLDHDGKGPTDLEAVALEQVPDAGDVFRAYANALGELGWSALAIKINAADYGVPQTRERIFVLASRVRRITVPEPTHAKGGEPETIFGPGRLSWVSMADALGWEGLVSEVRTEAYTERYGNRTRPRPTSEPTRTVTGRYYDSNVFAVRRSRNVAGSYTLDRRQGGAPILDVGVVPAPTITSQSVGSSQWVVKLAGGGDVIRVTEAEGAILQGFPAGYVWHGTNQRKRWEQIGNVVCPPVARRIVAELLGLEAAPLPWHAYAFAELAPASA